MTSARDRATGLTSAHRSPLLWKHAPAAVCFLITNVLVFHLSSVSFSLGLIGACAFAPPTIFYPRSLSPSRRALRETDATDVFDGRHLAISSRLHTERPTSENMHNVGGVECREVDVDIAVVGKITVLEATAKAQETLVEEAIRLEDDAADPGGRVHGEDVYGSILWPSASAVANYILEDKIDLSKRRILELGSGSGLVSIALARGGARKVIASDYESVPLQLLEYAESNLNPAKTRCCRIETVNLDICEKDIPLPEADIVVAADVMYESTTGKALAHRTMEALKRGSRVVIGCSPGRPGRPAFLKELKQLEPRIKANFVSALGTSRSRGQPKPEMSGPGEQNDVSVLILDLDPKSCLLPT